MQSNIKKRKFYALSILTGLLLWLAWPPLPFVFLIFIAFIPLLYLDDQLSDDASSFLRFFVYVYLAFFIWNLLTTWWIGKASITGALLAICVNPLLMAIPFLLFFKAKRALRPAAGYVALVAYYLTFEYLHMQWELAWPWLNLGNGLAKYPPLFQWYEYTGVLGGTLWIMTVNIFMYRAWKSYPDIREWVERVFPDSSNQRLLAVNLTAFRPAAILIIPILVSFFMYSNYEEEGQKANVTIVQPNFDPYEFYPGILDTTLNTLFQLSKPAITDSTDYVIWPEAVIQGNMWLNKPEAAPEFKRVADFAQQHSCTVVTGFFTYQEYRNEATATARYFGSGECCFDIFNSAIQLDSEGNYQVYHKSKLVPGVERIPYPWLFKILEPVALYLGGITGSLGRQQERRVFLSDSVGVAPVICFESVFGEYVTDYVLKGAQVIFIITNDGWWGNTAGYKQHLNYASLRAVETRRSIARCANTGISCFINARGDIRKATAFWEKAVVNNTIRLNDKITVYSRYGDYVGRSAGFVTIFLLLTTFVRNRTRKTPLLKD